MTVIKEIQAIKKNDIQPNLFIQSTFNAMEIKDNNKWIARLTQRNKRATRQETHSTLKEKQYKNYKKLRRNLIIAGILTIVLLLAFFLLHIKLDYSQKTLTININKNFNIEQFIGICSILTPVFITIYSVLDKTITSIKNKIEEEEHLRKIFFSEFKDMSRHLKANLRILIKLRFETAKLENKRMKPASIHFENLKLPAGSAIFSDKILLLIDRNIADDITRMQIKLRNMNNSAEWLKSLTEKKNYSASGMKKALDWEIYRTMTYLVNAHYMEKNEYHFATEEQLAEYLETQEIKDELALLFKGVVPTEYRERAVAAYIAMYHEDREKSRKVVLVPAGNIL